MAGSCGDEYYIFHSGSADAESTRKELGDAKIREYLRKYAWADAEPYARHSGPAAVFLQYASEDAPDSYPRHCYAIFGQPKQIKIYQVPHALNAQARKDRVEWLVERLALKPMDSSALSAIPQLK